MIASIVSEILSYQLLTQYPQLLRSFGILGVRFGSGVNAVCCEALAGVFWKAISVLLSRKRGNKPAKVWSNAVTM